MISIIVPIYNREKYLSECIDSILVQSYSDFEVLLIDDGSTDRSGEICDEYAQKDARIRVFHKENGGVSSARNVGLDNVQGEWVCFVDSDDTIAANYLEVLLKAAVENEADSSMGGFRYINSDKKVEIGASNRGMETVEENIKRFYACVTPDWHRYLWNRMLSADVIKKNHLRFNEKLYYKEDGLFLIQFLCSSNGIVGVANRIVYNYRQHNQSEMGILRQSFTPKFLTNAKSHNLIVKTLNKHHCSKEVLKIAKSQAYNATGWVISVMRESGQLSLSNVIYLEMTLCNTLGFLEYTNFRVRHIARFIRSRIKRILCIN